MVRAAALGQVAFSAAASATRRRVPLRVSRDVVKATLEDHAQGRLDAEITLVHYGDYECPYTRLSRLSVQVLQRELAERLLYVFR